MMPESIEEAYDGEISDYLLRARKWINRADQSAALAIAEGNSLDDSESMANIGTAHVLLAAVIILVKESP
jgi:hypothetical protein